MREDRDPADTLEFILEHAMRSVAFYEEKLSLEDKTLSINVVELERSPLSVQMALDWMYKA